MKKIEKFEFKRKPPNAVTPAPVSPPASVRVEIKRPSSLVTSGLRSAFTSSFQKAPPHLIVKARAGTGKTTTLIEGLKAMKGLEVSITPSPQQQAIWDSMMLSKDVRFIAMAAFNSAIAKELKNRVPPGVEAKTLHGMGFYAVTQAFPFLKGKDINEYRVKDLTAGILGNDRRSLIKTDPEMAPMLYYVEQLVSLCKMNLLTGTTDDINGLIDAHLIETGTRKSQIFDLVPQVLELCKNPHNTEDIDFSDMLWLPIVLNLPVFTNDLLLVDEFQDLNRCQQAFAKRAGKRIIGVGDPAQAIYGFAGADSESMARMVKELDAQELDLTVTRRCGKAIVAEACRLVPDFEAHESNHQGEIKRAPYGTKQTPEPNYRKAVRDGEMVLCRFNSLLVNQCFMFLKEGRKATIQGRKDVGRGLIEFIERMRKKVSHEGNKPEVAQFIEVLTEWLKAEEDKENAKKDPKQSKLDGLRERYDCLLFFCEELESIDAIVKKIDTIFTDNVHPPGIILSSIHKAKGLESRCVFLLCPQQAPCPLITNKMKPWQKQQEYNLKYVAITRAIEEFTYVS